MCVLKTFVMQGGIRKKLMEGRKQTSKSVIIDCMPCNSAESKKQTRTIQYASNNK